MRSSLDRANIYDGIGSLFCIVWSSESGSSLLESETFLVLINRGTRACVTHRSKSSRGGWPGGLGLGAVAPSRCQLSLWPVGRMEPRCTWRLPAGGVVPEERSCPGSEVVALGSWCGGVWSETCSKAVSCSLYTPCCLPASLTSPMRDLTTCLPSASANGSSSFRANPPLFLQVGL